ncbi:MAG: hypothetical protein ACLQVL_29560 [Terriglobia bacterium]
MGTAFVEGKALRKLAKAKYICSPKKAKAIEEIMDPKFMKNYRVLLCNMMPRHLSESFGDEETGYMVEEEVQALADLKRANAELRSYISGHLPHREIFRLAVLFLIFFSGTLTVQTLLGVLLVSPVFAWIGIGLSAAGALLSWLGRFDWENWMQGKF